MIILSMGLGFAFLSLAMRDIPLGTAYAIWTGLGAAGAVIMGILFFKESAGWKRLLFLSCIIAGAVGLKVRSEEHTSELQSRGHLVCSLLHEKKTSPHR